MTLRIFITLALLAGAARAEFLNLEVHVADMNCQPCSESLEQSLKKLRGVEKAEVDYKAGNVRVDLAEKNRLGVEQVWDTIKRVGFTPGETKVRVRGAIKNGKLEIPESGRILDIDGDAPQADLVELRGSITPPENPRLPIVIKLR